MPRRSYNFIAWKEEGIWTVHSPSVPGVYGLGSTFASAKKDFIEALVDMLDYLSDVGEQAPRPTALRVGEVLL